MTPNTRRTFLADVGSGMLAASLGSALACDLGLASETADGPDALDFGKLEPLASLLQDMPPNKLMPALVAKLKGGTDLRTLVAAGALANARAFGGRHYEGYHTFMALGPAFEMAKELPDAQKPLPVLKVLYRNATHIQASGGRKNEVLKPVKGQKLSGEHPGEVLRDLTRKNQPDAAEQIFAGIGHDADDMLNHALYAVADDINVHRVVLAWRAWAMLDFTGPEHAHTLLRQTVLFCCKENRQGKPVAIQTQLPKLMDQYKLAGKKPGTRAADTKWVEDLAKIIYGGGREKAADAAAAALAEGFSPDAIAEATALAANTLLLNDPGRPKQYANDAKPPGSVHGDSVGLHASDAANAWRQIARVSNARNTFASLIVGAYHTAGQDGGQLKDPPHAAELANVKGTDPAALLRQLDDAVKAGNQAVAAAVAQKYGAAGHAPRPLCDVLLKYGVSEDGALHAEKYYRTATEEFAVMRSEFRWRQLVALARVTASEHGRPAPGYAEAKKLLGV